MTRRRHTEGCVPTVTNPREWLSESCQTYAKYISEIDAVRVSQVGRYDEPQQAVYLDVDELDAIRALFP